MTRVAFVGSAIGSGGIERLGSAVMTTLGLDQCESLSPGTNRRHWVTSWPQHRRVIDRLKPEVVFTDRLYFAPYALALAAKSSPRPRLVLWLHGSEVASSRHSTAKHAVLSRFDSLICSSTFTRDSVAETAQGSALTKRLTVCNPGVDTRYWERRSAKDPGASNQTDGRLLVLSVGRLTANAVHKGMDRVVAAVGTLRNENVPIRLVVVGDGPHAAGFDRFACSALGSDYERQARVSDTELGAMYADAHVMALPSVPTKVGDRTFVEGFGLVFLEAAACGTQSIGGLRSGATDAIHEERSGQLVTGSVSSIVTALRRVVEGTTGSTPESCREWARDNQWESRLPQLQRAVLGQLEVGE